MASSIFTAGPIEVDSPKVVYTAEHITAEYDYKTTAVTLDAGKVVAKPLSEKYTLRTTRKVPKTGVLFVGWGGNNGTTVTASLLAHQKKVTWRTARGEHKPDFLGSLTQASTVRLGNAAGRDVYAPMTSLLPMVDPTQLVVGGWDISGMNMGDAMRRAGVLDYDLQRQLYDDLTGLKPMPSVYFPDFIAANQSARADNVLTGTKQEQMDRLRADIRDFKAANDLDTVMVLWTANTERFCTVAEGVNTTAADLLKAVAEGHAEVAPSTLFAVASILEGCTFINGSPQNTLVPGAIELAAQHGVFIAGDDFKSGQTKMKSVLVDFLVSAGIKPVSIVSYNHLGNNDGKNLSAPQQFRSKEISKSNVVDDMVASNGLMFAKGEKPDHCVVIKYVPYVGDSKRALDEYTAEIFMGGLNTISMHNTCEDSLLASPLILDLIVLGELCERIQLKKEGEAEFHGFHSVLSLLSFLLKAPMVASGTPVVNALFKQREAIVNVLRACIGLDPENHMLLEHRIHTAGTLAPGGVALDTTGGYSLTGGAAAAGAGADSCGKPVVEAALGNGAAADEAKMA